MTFEFNLKKAVGPSAFVRTPHGSPAIGADVYLTSSENGLGLRNNQLQPPLGRQFRTQTDEKGHFAFAPQDGPRGVLIVHAEGVAQRSADDLARSSGITLERFGRIEGTLRIGSMLGSRQPIRVWLNRSAHSRDSFVACNYTGETDDQGRFAIDKVLPGKATVSRSSSPNGIGTAFNTAPPLDVVPGQTVRVEIGGQARIERGLKTDESLHRDLGDPVRRRRIARLNPCFIRVSSVAKIEFVNIIDAQPHKSRRGTLRRRASPALVTRLGGDESPLARPLLPVSSR